MFSEQAAALLAAGGSLLSLVLVVFFFPEIPKVNDDNDFIMTVMIVTQ